MKQPVYTEVSERKLSRAEIPTAPHGLYELDEPHFVKPEFYDPVYDVIHHEVECRLLVRIDDEDELPRGVEQAYYRADGSRVVVGIVMCV